MPQEQPPRRDRPAARLLAAVDRKRRQWPSQTLQSAPFDKRLRKKMNGSVVPREIE